MRIAPIFLDAVIGGLGLAVSPYWVVYDNLQSGRVVQVLADYVLPETPIYARYPQREHLPKRVSVFIDCLAEQLVGRAALGEKGPNTKLEAVLELCAE